MCDFKCSQPTPIVSNHQIDTSTRYTIPSLQSSLRSSAFEVYRKPTTPKGFTSPESAATAAANVPTQQYHHHQSHPGGPLNSSSNSSRQASLNEYERRVSVISDALRNVSFKSDRNLNDVMHHLKEQNHMLLRLCNDLSEELTSVQRKKEELRSRFITSAAANAAGTIAGNQTIV